MKTIIIAELQTGKKIDKIIKETFPQMPVSALFKAFRKKDIKVNGIRVKDDYIVALGDKLEIFIVDEILDGTPLEQENKQNKSFSVVYEDKNILVVNKDQGIPVHPDKEQATNTLIDQVQNYLQQKEEYNPLKPSSFTPALCHRLDRNTSGLVIIAKNNESLKILLSKIRDREIKKFYQCLVSGKMENNQAELKAFLYKQEKKSRVFVDDKKSKDAVEIITKYKVLSFENDISLLEVELVTGRTHQIRAHLAHIGHPIIGDGKYGTNTINRKYAAKHQALCAYKIVFDFYDGGMLNYLKGRTFEVIPEFKIK
jgi:23S rRNA pseudouridine955/2504/2580 synthase